MLKISSHIKVFEVGKNFCHVFKKCFLPRLCVHDIKVNIWREYGFPSLFFFEIVLGTPAYQSLEQIYINKRTTSGSQIYQRGLHTTNGYIFLIKNSKFKCCANFELFWSTLIVSFGSTPYFSMSKFKTPFKWGNE